MESEALISYIQQAKKSTPSKVYLKSRVPLHFPNAKVFGLQDQIIFGDWEEIKVILQAHQEEIITFEVEPLARNSGVALSDLRQFPARIEPGAIIREHVEIGERAIIMMGAILNIGVCVGADTMIDMGAVLGGRAIVKERCHIGANAVLAGVIEPASATPVVIEDEVMIGANAVILEGVHVHRGAVVGAGAVVLHDVEADTVVAGVPARVIKQKDLRSDDKTKIIQALR